jgi:hypothetical protein
MTMPAISQTMTQSVANPMPPEVESPEQSAPADEVSGSNPAYSMTPAGVLQYCEDQMQSINAQFNAQVEGVSSMNKDSQLIGNLKSQLAAYESGGINYDTTANGGQGAPNVTDGGNANYDTIEASIQAAIGQANAEGNTGLVNSLTQIQTTFASNNSGGADKVVNPSEITSMCDQLDTAASGVTSNQQVAMITVGQIANTLNSVMTQMSQIIQGMDQTTLKIASNT